MRGQMLRSAVVVLRTVVLLALVVLTLAGCDFGLAADEAEAEENAMRTRSGTVTSVTPEASYDPKPTTSTAEKGTVETTPLHVFHLQKRGMDEPVPGYFPTVGPPIDDPPGPCPPPAH